MHGLARMLAATTLLVGAAELASAQSPPCPGWRDPVGKRIVGGVPASLAQWPSQAVLRLSSPNSSQSVFMCGGTALASDWVLTAAHCFDAIKKQASGGFVSTDSATTNWTLDVVLGSDDLGRLDKGNIFPVSDIRIHETYKPDSAQSHGFDIALIRLERRWTGPVATLSLDVSTDPVVPPGAGLTVAGFGLVKGEPKGGALVRHERKDGSAFFAGSKRLRHVGVPMVTTAQCAARWTGKLVAAGQICAGFEGGAKDSCDGDSGGPLVTYDVRGCPTHVGLVSWGAGDCGAPKTYGVYTRLSHHANWLRRHVPGVLTRTPAVPLAAGADLPPGEFVAQVTELIGSAGGSARIGVRGGSTVKNGSQYAFEVMSNLPGRLVIVDVNVDGVATQIFPNEFVQRDELSLIAAGQTITVPGPGYGFDHFRAEPPFGKGQLIVLVLPPDFPVHQLITEPTRARGFRPERSAAGYFMNLIQQINTHLGVQRSAPAAGGPAWAVTSTEYEIVP